MNFIVILSFLFNQTPVKKPETAKKENVIITVEKKTKPNSEKKSNILSRNRTAAVTGGILFVPTLATLVGMQLWEWGDQTHFKASSDGWFSSKTTHGGADKLGHAWSFFVGTKIFTYYFDHVFPENHTKAALLGALLSSLGGVAVEIGDGFATDYGFSYTDIVFNSLGVLIALGQELFPWFDNLVDFSLYLFPSPGFTSSKNKNKTDVPTDYSGQLATLNIRLGGIPLVKDTFLRYFRLDVGYFTRCYQPYDACSKEMSGVSDFESRNLYFGFSFDFARMISDKYYRTTGQKFAVNFLRVVNLNGAFPVGFNVDFNKNGKVSFGTQTANPVNP